jgi:hypothetical protein
MLVRGVRQGADAVPGSHDVSGQGQPTWMLMALVAIADFPAPALPVINTALIGAYHRQILKAAQRVCSPTRAMDGLTTGAGTQRIFTCLR